MQKLRVVVTVAGLAALTIAWGAQRPASGTTSQKSIADTIIALERAALDRWGRGDPQGYIEIYAPEITYFDPFTERRLDGIEALKKMVAPFTGKIKVDSFRFINPRVQVTNDIGILSFNLESHARNPDGTPRTVHWNSTEVYRRAGGRWRIVHTHWSLTRPELKQPGTP